MDLQDETDPEAKPGKRKPMTARPTIVNDLWRTAERQISACAARMEAADPVEQEKEARTLATLAKTIRELVEIDRVRKSGPAAASESGSTDLELDRFRTELARELDRLRQSGGAASAAGRA